jgi:hypothetical protein
MILVLLIIGLFRASSSSVKPEDERVPLGRSGFNGIVLKFESFILESDASLFDHETV